MRSLDWKWIGLGVLIMLALNLAVGLVLTLLWGEQIQQAATAEEAEAIGLTTGQVIVLAVLNFLVYAVGGYIVGAKSAGRTILEPGLSAAIAVLLALVIAGNFSVGGLIAGALVPFLAGLLGGWLGERRQGTA